MVTKGLFFQAAHLTLDTQSITFFLSISSDATAKGGGGRGKDLPKFLGKNLHQQLVNNSTSTTRDI